MSKFIGNGIAIAVIDANVDAILADTNEIQAELADGGRTDLLLDNINIDTDAILFTQTVTTPDDAGNDWLYDVIGNKDDTVLGNSLVSLAKIINVDTNAIETDTNEVQAELADGGRTDLLIDGIITSLGNPTNMGAVTQSETGDVAAYVKYHREVSRIKNQSRIGLVVPDYANIASDPDNLALFAQLLLVSVPNYIDQTGVDGGNQDWLTYDLVVVGSDKYAAFTVGNLDDLDLLKVPILVCNSPVAAYIHLGTAAADGDSSVDEYCKLITHRVPMLEFGSTGDKTIFSPAATSDRLDMSDPQLVEDVILTNAVGNSNTTTVLGWLSAANAVGTRNKLDNNVDIPAGRVFGGCFNNADNLNTLGLSLFRRVVRNLALSEINVDITLNANASKLVAIEADTNELQTDWTNDGRLDVILDSIKAKTDYSQGLVYYGVVTQMNVGNKFTVASLLGLGAGKFSDATDPYYAFVLRDNDGIGGAPQGQMRVITGYATATGEFTTAAFTSNVDIGDEVLIITPKIATVKAAVDAVAADSVLLKADLGDASASTLTSIYGILGNPATTITAQIAAVAAQVTAVDDYVDTEVASLLADVGDASASTLGSILNIIGNPASSSLTTTLEAMAAKFWTHQADAVLAQAAAAQNTWYDVLPAASGVNCRIQTVSFQMEDSNETLEARIIIDGVTYTTAGTACSKDANYWLQFGGACGPTFPTPLISIINNPQTIMMGTDLRGKSVQISVRKTTAVGANTLNGRVIWEKWV